MKTKDTTFPTEVTDTQAIRDLFLEDHPNDNISTTSATWLVRVLTAVSFAGSFIGVRLYVKSGDIIGGFWGGILTDIILVVVVLALTVGMVHFLRLFVSAPLKRCLSLLVYIPLLLFSVMFGFTFYWQRVEAPKQSANLASENLQNYIQEIEITTANLFTTQESLDLLSRQFSDLAEKERQVGGTCGTESPPGNGPRQRHRDRRAGEIADQIKQIEVVTRNISPRLGELREYMPKLRQLLNDREDGLTSSTRSKKNESNVQRRERIFNEARQIALAVNREINSIASSPIISTSSLTFGQWADEYYAVGLVRNDDPRGTPYICSSPTAGLALRTASTALNDLPTLSVPRTPTFGGSAGTREAMKRFLGSLSVGFKQDVEKTDADKRQRYDSNANTSNLDGKDESKVRSDAARSIQNGETSASDYITTKKSRLVQDDYLPLFFAALVDFLLFGSAIAERGTRSRTQKARGRIREAVRETINPLHVPLLRAKMKEEEAWKILRPYRFSIGFDDFFVALPALNDDDAIQIRDTLKAWMRLGMARRFPMKLDELKKRLVENDNIFMLQNIKLVEDRTGEDSFEPLVVQLTSEADTLALLSTIFKGIAPGPRESEPLLPAEEKPTGLKSFKNVFRASSSLFERKLNSLADRLDGKDYTKTKTQEDFRKHKN